MLTDFLATETQSDRKQNIHFSPFKAHHFSSESFSLCREGILSYCSTLFHTSLPRCTDTWSILPVFSLQKYMTLVCSYAFVFIATRVLKKVTSHLTDRVHFPYTTGSYIIGQHLRAVYMTTENQVRLFRTIYCTVSTPLNPEIQSVLHSHTCYVQCC